MRERDRSDFWTHLGLGLGHTVEVSQVVYLSTSFCDLDEYIILSDLNWKNEYCTSFSLNPSMI